MRKKKGERKCDKKMKRDKITKKKTEWHKDKIRGKKEWYKDKVTEKQNEKRQSNERDRVT